MTEKKPKVLVYKDRKENGEYHYPMKEAKRFDHELFLKISRMLPTIFEELFTFIGTKDQKISSQNGIHCPRREIICCPFIPFSW